MSKAIKRITVGGVSNAHDLGGLRTSDGQAIKPHRLIRSSDLGYLYPELADALVANHEVRQVIDLRAAKEVWLNQDINLEGVAYHHCPIGDGLEDLAIGELPERFDKITSLKVRKTIGRCLLLSRRYLGDDSGDAVKAMEFRYREFVTSQKAVTGLKEAIGYIIDSPEGATLFHGADGKDATGVLAYLLLLILGVKEEDAVQDYLLSNRFLNAYIEEFKSMIEKSGLKEIDPQMYESALAAQGVHRSWIDAVQREIDGKGGIEAYFQNVLGFTSEQIALLRQRYLEPAPEKREALDRKILVFHLGVEKDVLSFNYVLASQSGTIVCKESFDPIDVQGATAHIAMLKEIVKTANPDIVTFRSAEEIAYAQKEGLDWLETIFGNRPLFDLGIALDSFASRFKKCRNPQTLYENLVGYGKPGGKSAAELLLDSFLQMIQDLAYCPGFPDSIHHKKYRCFFLTIRQIKTYLTWLEKDKERKSEFMNRLKTQSIRHLVAFDIECSNTHNGGGKICEFGDAIANADGFIESTNKCLINPGKGKKYDFDLIGRKGQKDLHLKYEANDYEAYRKSKEFDEYADNIRFLFEKMPYTLYFGFAVGNDLSYLNYSFRRYKLKPIKGLFAFDVQRIYQGVYGKNPSLEKVCEDFLEQDDYDPSQCHDSEYDAKVTAKILAQLLKENKQKIKELLLKYGQETLICNETESVLKQCQIPSREIKKLNLSENSPYSKRGPKNLHSKAHEFLAENGKTKDMDDLLDDRWDGKRIGISGKLKSTRIWQAVYDKIIEDGYRFVNDTQYVDIMLCLDEGECRLIGEAINRPIKRVIFDGSMAMDQMIEEKVYTDPSAHNETGRVVVNIESN